MMKVVRSSPTANNGDRFVGTARTALRKDRKAYSALAIQQRRMTRSAENRKNDLSSSSATADVKLSDSLTNYFSPSSAKRPKKLPAKLMDNHSASSINDSVSPAKAKTNKTVLDSGSSDDVVILEDCKTQPSLEVSNTSKSKTFSSRNSSSKVFSNGSTKPKLCRISSKSTGPPEELGDYLSGIFLPHTSRRDRAKLQTLSHPARHSAASLSSHAGFVAHAQLLSKAIEKPLQERSSRTRSKPTSDNDVVTTAEKRFVLAGKKRTGTAGEPGEATESLKPASDPSQSSMSSKSSSLEVSNVSPMHRVFRKHGVINVKRLKFKRKRKKPVPGKVPDGLVDYLSRFFTPNGSRRERAKPLVPDVLKPSSSRKAEAMTKSSTFAFQQAKSPSVRSQFTVRSSTTVTVSNNSIEEVVPSPENSMVTSCPSTSPNLVQNSGQNTQTKPSVSTKLAAEPTFTDSQPPNVIRKIADNKKVPSTNCSDSNASVLESQSPKPSAVVKKAEKIKPQMITLQPEGKFLKLIKFSNAKSPKATIPVQKAKSAPTAANRRKLVSVRSRKSEEAGKIFSNSYSSYSYGRKAAGGGRKTSNTSSESSTSRRKRNTEAANLHDQYSAYFTPSGPRRAKPAPGEIFKPVRRKKSQSRKLSPASGVMEPKETLEPPPVSTEKECGECSAQVPSPKDDRPASDAFLPLQKAECISPSSPPARPFGSPTSAFQPYKKTLVSPEVHSSDSSASVIILTAAATSQVAINPVLPQSEDADIIPPSPPRRPSSRRSSISPSKRASTTNVPLGSPPRQTIAELEAELAKLSNDNMVMLASVGDTSANDDVLDSPPRQTIAQLEAELAKLNSEHILMVDRTSAAKASQSEPRLSVSSPPLAEASRSASRMLTYPQLDPQNVLTPLFDQPNISFSGLEILAEAASKEAEAVSSIVRSSVTSVQPDTATSAVPEKPEPISISPGPEIRRSRRGAERNANKRLNAEAQALDTTSEVEKAKGNQRKRRQSKPKAAKTGESSTEDDDVDLKDLLANQDITEILTMDNFMKLPEDERRQLAALFPNGQLDIDDNYFKNPIFKEAIVDYASRIGLEWIKKNGEAAFDTLKPLIDQLSKRKLEWFADDLHKAEVDPEYFA